MPRKEYQTGERDGPKQKPMMRWTLLGAEREFAVNKKTLEKRRRMLSIEPGKDGMFSTYEITAMVHGDKEAAIHGKIEDERAKIQIETARLAKTLMLTSDAEIIWADFFVKMRQSVAGADYIPEADRERLMGQILSLDIEHLKIEA